MIVLGACLEYAVGLDRLSRNPARAVRQPSAVRVTEIQALSPADVERIRARLEPRDAALVSVLAYAGVRPGEALALTWPDWSGEHLLVNKRVSLGEVEKSAKSTARRSRTVGVLDSLAADLREWRLAAGMPKDGLVFPRPDGDPWQETDYRNWRRRRFYPAVEEAGLPKMRPYDLRHSYASLRLAERANPVEVAEELGHSVAMLFRTYSHVIEGLRGKDKVDGNDEIRRARL